MFKSGQYIEYIGRRRAKDRRTPYLIEDYDDSIGVITIEGERYWSYERIEGEDGVGRLRKCWIEWMSEEDRRRDVIEKMAKIMERMESEEYKKMITREKRRIYESRKTYDYRKK